MQVDEAAYALRDYLGKLESDPARLEDVESRLAALDKLKRKYGPTLKKFLSFRDDVAKRMMKWRMRASIGGAGEAAGSCCRTDMTKSGRRT